MEDGSCVRSVRTCHCEPLGEAVSSYVKAEIASDCVLAMTCTHLIDEPIMKNPPRGRDKVLLPIPYLNPLTPTGHSPYNKVRLKRHL